MFAEPGICRVGYLPRLHAHELADVRGADIAQLDRLVLLPRPHDHLVAPHELRRQPICVVLHRLRGGSASMRPAS